MQCSVGLLRREEHARTQKTAQFSWLQICNHEEPAPHQVGELEMLCNTRNDLSGLKAQIDIQSKELIRLWHPFSDDDRASPQVEALKHVVSNFFPRGFQRTRCIGCRGCRVCASEALDPTCD